MYFNNSTNASGQRFIISRKYLGNFNVISRMTFAHKLVKSWCNPFTTCGLDERVGKLWVLVTLRINTVYDGCKCTPLIPHTSNRHWFPKPNLASPMLLKCVDIKMSMYEMYIRICYKGDLYHVLHSAGSWHFVIYLSQNKRFIVLVHDEWNLEATPSAHRRFKPSEISMSDGVLPYP